MNTAVDQLNTSQREAVDWGDGPLLVQAGPGSGKTKVLTLRIHKLIDSSPNESFRVLGLTFTVKAAREMQDRIRDLGLGESWRCKLCTFHSFCTDLLRQHGSHLGLKPDFSIITDEKDRAALLLEADDSVNDNPEDLLRAIDSMFRRGITARELPELFQGDQEGACQALQNGFQAYLKKLLESNQLDFGSMLHFTRELLESNPRIAEHVRTVYRYICVDEFQDTNMAQYKILRLLSPGKSSNLFVVADDDQVIFQWNGASPDRLNSLKRDYSLEIIHFPENHRCPPEIVEIANRLIANNPGRPPEKLKGVSRSQEEGVVRLKGFAEFDKEIEWLASELKSVHEEFRKTCLVIARSNKLLEAAKEALLASGVKSEIVRKKQDFSSPLVQLMYYSLKVANSPNSRSLLNKLCSSASLVNSRPISAEDVDEKARVEGIPPLRAFFLQLRDSDTLGSFAISGLELLCESLKYRDFVQESFRLFDDLNSKGKEKEDAFPDYSADKQAWRRISNDVSPSNGKNLSLHAFLQYTDLAPKEGELSKDCVRLQTVHTSKGTEFEWVFLIGLAEEHFPAYFAIEKNDATLQEERRACFVAITRSSKYLYLSFAREYFGWKKEPSRFLKEMGLELP